MSRLARQIVSHEYAAGSGWLMFGKPVLRLEDARRTTRRNQRLVEAIVRVVSRHPSSPIGRRVARQGDEAYAGQPTIPVSHSTPPRSMAVRIAKVSTAVRILGDVSQILA